jgi:hypothetical protein
VEGFTSAASFFQPFLVAAGAVISLATVVSDILELSFIGNPLRRIVPKGPSQNLVAVVPPAAQHRQDLVLIGHIDTARTPLIFSTARWLAICKAFITVEVVFFISQPLLHTRVWLACTGCEEVQHYGAADFFRRHRGELLRPAVIAFETLGCTIRRGSPKKGASSRSTPIRG